MKIKDVISHLELLAPRHYAEDFDNTGLLTGDKNTDLSGILVTLDCLENVVDEAIENNCNLIVSFHPIIFSGLKHLQPSDYVRSAVVKAIKNDIAIYATHTALDVTKGGVSYRMAQEMGLNKVKTLLPKSQLIKKLVTYIPANSFEEVKEALFNAGAGSLGNYTDCSFSISGIGTFKGNEDSKPKIGEKLNRENIEEKMLSITFLPHLESTIKAALIHSHPYEEVSFEISTLENSYQNIGMGTIGELPESLSVEEFLQKTKTVFKTGVVRSSLSRKRNIKKVALLGGSGAFAIKNAIQSGADAYITADLKYHDFFQGQDILLCDVGHYESEQFTKNLLHEYLTEKFSSFAVLCAQARTNPVNYF
ncbi:dinuclear metal center YbgI/SA1388 family protein [Nonlabens xylanidelens]|uniref:GTP cyclohydrolase 1 type 2 homolog n=1 Tax=Nonlabens xylanidelens TaxID=191564 RepID=A0A2S6IJJ1_9FLAO|nr:Nif3-like dinuclear metal center hexameric protein [Nonlabens xylanidelens]PPK94379.1 dinuclear metal center YbgI/SA1388 family protein [Nonlabens xylanidelens]PQJ21458.1 Nif3-like dinuclear metal center hexameric protein [Nonlabens xylanidelens]